MRCPYCGAKATDVIDSRTSSESAVVRRRRECLQCEKRFTTYERPEIELYVIKKDGRREKFDKQKLLAGITKACEKRPISRERIMATVDAIERELLRKDKVEIPSKVIGELVMQRLRKLDEVAYVRFASVYRQFADVHDFKDILKFLKK